MRALMMDLTCAPLTPSTTSRRSRWPLWAVFVLCALPTLAALLAYWHPPSRAWLTSGRTSNYGAVLDPQRPLPVDLRWVGLDGQRLDAERWRGKWLMLVRGPAECNDACVRRLYAMRQVRAALGKEQTRVERLWIVTSPGTVAPVLREAYAGTTMARTDASALARWLPDDDEAALYLVDPLGNLMMRWPADADPARVRKDLARLLWASRIG